MRSALAWPVVALFVHGAALAQTASASAPLPLRDFARFPEFSDVTISPTGEYLAAKIRVDGSDALGVIRRSDMKITATIKLDEGRSVGEYRWIGPQRVAAQVLVPMGSVAQPFNLGEIVAKDAEGTRLDYVAGHEDLRTIGTRVQRRESIKGWSSIVTSPKPDPQRTLIKTDAWTSARFGGHSTVYEVNSYSGIRKKVVSSPFPGHSRFLADWDGQVRYVAGRNVQNEAQAWYRLSAEADWTSLKVAATGSEAWPIAFAPDNQRVYLSADEGGSRHCLVEHALPTNERRTLACDADGDLEDVIMSFDGGKRPIAAVFAADRPKVVMLDSKDPDSRLLAAITRGFPGHAVVPVSQTQDGSLLILRAYSDRNPGQYFLFDTKTRNARLLMQQRGWIDSARQAEMRTFRMTARDGTPLFGYITVPPGRALDKLPMVVMPHGGPIGVRDHWGWEPDAQALASRGYAVLKVNFRGSGGYGAAFRALGHGAWGSGMIDDISDAVRWAVTQGYADSSRLCIFGASYGGYAALMSAVREPDLYRCAIGYAGVYNLQTMLEDTAYAESVQSLNFFRRTLGSDPAVLAAQSPMTHLAKLKAAVMLVHGKKDEIAPYSQATELRSALQQLGRPHEWLDKPLEAHGFYAVENIEELLGKVIAFLDRHIGVAPAPVPAASAQAAAGP